VRLGATIVAGALLAGPAQADSQAGLRWERNYDVAKKKAKETKKPLLVDFWAEWCTWCHRLDRTTYVDPQVVKLAEDFIAVKVNTEGTPREAAIALQYDVTSLPTIAFLSPAGHPILRLRGYLGPGQFPESMVEARELAAKVMGWEAALDKNAKDAAALFGLGRHLYQQEDYEESRELLAAATIGDASQPVANRKLARLLLGSLTYSYEQKYEEAEAILKAGLAIEPPHEYDAKLLYVLGKNYLAWGKKTEARAAFQEIVKDHAESPVAEKARETLVALDRNR